MEFKLHEIFIIDWFRFVSYPSISHCFLVIFVEGRLTGFGWHPYCHFLHDPSNYLAAATTLENCPSLEYHRIISRVVFSIVQSEMNMRYAEEEHLRSLPQLPKSSSNVSKDLGVQDRSPNDRQKWQRIDVTHNACRWAFPNSLQHSTQGARLQKKKNGSKIGFCTVVSQAPKPRIVDVVYLYHSPFPCTRTLYQKSLRFGRHRRPFLG